MTRIIQYLTLILTLTVSTIALAHGGGHDVMGTVKAFDASSLTIVTVEQKEVKVQLDDKTRFERDGAPIKAAEVAVGARVVVHTKTKEGAKEPTAVLVKLAPADGHADHPSK